MSEKEEFDSSKQGAVILVLKLSACCVFAARGWLYLRQFGPLSTFFWNQRWLEQPLLQFFGMSWESYAAVSEPLIISMHRLLGCLFVVAAVSVWWVRPRSSWLNGVVWSGLLFLLPHWFLRWADSSYQFPMLLELCLQCGMPLLLLLYQRVPHRCWVIIAGIFVSFTFVGHGLYALGWGVPRPHSYVNMTMKLVGVSEPHSIKFLIVYGSLDLLLPAALLLSYRVRMIGLSYAAAWGMATAFARVFSHVTPAEKYYGMDPWLAECVVRFAHGLVPFALILFLYQLRCTVSNKV